MIDSAGRSASIPPRTGFLNQLTSEEVRTRFVREHPVRYWFKPSGKQTEALDRRVYALAALHARLVPWEVLLRAAPTEPPPQPPSPPEEGGGPRRLPPCGCPRSRPASSAGAFDSESSEKVACGLSWDRKKKCDIAATHPADLRVRERSSRRASMPSTKPDLWGNTHAYERYMGRWSKNVAPLFLQWLGAPIKKRWIDIGCGTGELTEVIANTCDASLIVGVDSAEGFLEAARARLKNVDFCIGKADNLDVPNDSFDYAVSGLVLNFVPDAQAALAEMVRVVRPGGTVALYVWDYAGHMQIMRYFFDTAILFDARSAEFDDGVKTPICRPGPLQSVFASAGLENIAVKALDIPTAFENFDDYWARFLGGVGSAPKYCVSLDEATRNKIRTSLQAKLPTGPDGEILLAARAWAVKGTVPS